MYVMYALCSVVRNEIKWLICRHKMQSKKRGNEVYICSRISNLFAIRMDSQFASCLLFRAVSACEKVIFDAAVV